MKNFNNQRFLNFAKYDFVINKTFYRNLTIGTFAGVFGIIGSSFMYRWMLWHTSCPETPEALNLPEENIMALVNQFDITPSATMACFFLVIMWTVFSGCWAHNLRNKQGRISELTLPATNLEKFTWHTLAMIVGGFLVCTLSFFLCDLINYIASCLVMSPGVTSWYTEKIFDTFFPSKEVQDGIIFNALWVLACAIFGNLGVYAFGNSVKYKYNIVLTYIATMVFGFVVFIITMMLAVSGFENTSQTLSSEDAQNIVYAFITILSLLEGTLGFYFAYKLYTRAQITSGLNK